MAKNVDQPKLELNDDASILRCLGNSKIGKNQLHSGKGSRVLDTIKAKQDISAGRPSTASSSKNVTSVSRPSTSNAQRNAGEHSQPKPVPQKLGVANRTHNRREHMSSSNSPNYSGGISPNVYQQPSMSNNYKKKESAPAHLTKTPLNGPVLRKQLTQPPASKQKHSQPDKSEPPKVKESQEMTRDALENIYRGRSSSAKKKTEEKGDGKKARRKRNKRKSEKGHEISTKPEKTSQPSTVATSSSAAGKQILDMVNGGVKQIRDKQQESISDKTKPAQQVLSSSMPSIQTQKSATALQTKEPNKSKSETSESFKVTAPLGTTQNTEEASSSSQVRPTPTQKALLPTPQAILPTPKPLLSSPTMTSSPLDVDSAKLVLLGLEQATERLKKDHVVFLHKKSTSFPTAKFFCQLCNYHLDNVPLAHRHIKEKRHRKLFKECQQDDLLRQLSMPSDKALEVLQNLLVTSVLKGSVLEKEDLKQRKSVIGNLAIVIRKALPGAEVTMYGSSLSGFGFKTSDINVDIHPPSDIKAPIALITILDILAKSDAYTDVASNFRAKVPRIDFKDMETCHSIRLSTGNEGAIFTNQLLRLYFCLDPRLFQLAMVFRTWGHLCKLDLQHEGSLPPHTFTLMAIFFMQMKKYLPVLHEIITDKDMQRILSSSMNCTCIVEKGSKFWYIPSPPVKEGKSDEKMEADEEIESDNQTPVDLCAGCEGADLNLAQLWLQLLKFYALEYPLEDEVISICTSKRLKREDKNWSKKRVAVIDPYASKRNLCRSMNAQAVFTYMMSRLKAAVIYFFKPTERLQVTARSTSTSKTPSKEPEKYNAPVRNEDFKSLTAVDGRKSPKEFDFADELSRRIVAKVLNCLNESTKKKPEGDNTVNGVTPTSVNRYVAELIEELVAEVSDLDTDSKLNAKLQSKAEEVSKSVTSDALSEICAILNSISLSETSTPTDESTSKDCSLLLDDDDDSVEAFIKSNQQNLSDNIEYEFTVDTITGGKFPVSVCGLCKKEGHSRKNCPDEIHTLQICALPPLTSQHGAVLDRVCEAMFKHYVLSYEEIQQRNAICRELANFLQTHFDPNTSMSLFGSSRNGFGFGGSDLDICMTYSDDETGEGLDYARIIEMVAKHLRRNVTLRCILPITTAKVPIVKFEHRETGLEGDISLYNLLAQRNTSMLKAYSSIDYRCRVLGYSMKAFVKLCNIGDASRGSLSSYAYTLMVIFFLQQRNPPVLPVLQELHGESRTPEHIVDGWNSWYFNDILNLHKVWNGYGKNKESIGSLWLGLLRYYTEDFDFKKYVISIRQQKQLTAFEKEWTSKHICIEDPFDLSHNLGAGVSHKMTYFIIRVFIKAREHFGTLPKFRLNGNQAVHYFFDPTILTDGEEVPNDRCCRICGKIGHFVRDCPKNKRSRKNKESNAKDDSNEQDLSDYRCFHCGGLGHIKRECPELKKLNESQKNRSKALSTPKSKQKPTPTPSTPQRENGPKPSTPDSHKAQRKIDLTKSPTTPKVQNEVTPTVDNNQSPQVKAQRKLNIPKQGSHPIACETTQQLSTELEEKRPTPSPGGRSCSDGMPSPSSLSRSAPMPSYPWSPVGAHPSSPIAMSLPPPQLPSSGFYLPPPMIPQSPMNMMTLAQIETELMKEGGKVADPGMRPNEPQRSHQGHVYPNLRNFIPRPISNPMMVAPLPGMAMGVPIPRPQFPNLIPSPGMPPLPLNLTGSPSSHEMTSPLRHHTSSQYVTVEQNGVIRPPHSNS
ncbi:terminal uridylyltransferase 7-like isoform X3 [Clavelina lepadiformis]|uniref:terminal uridylyltransferase 7-like isoform X3 n=1 Tax=Clavelina lepadiformis TaxID=159417 RepID=UPI004042459B